MNQYVTGAVIKELREKNNVTQLQLADKLGVSDKTISKWETGKGYPDITLLDPIANALSVSVAELISGNTVAFPILCVSGLWKCNSWYGRICDSLSWSITATGRS